VSAKTLAESCASRKVCTGANRCALAGAVLYSLDNQGLSDVVSMA